MTHEKLEKYLKRLFGPTVLDGNATEDRGYLLMDYNWQANMGDLKFNQNSFPNVKDTVAMIK